jgi:UDP-N-acetylmuramate--alanine ligase
MYQKRQSIHFVGIGGIGMSGIAELLVNLGHQVSGSDLREGEATRRLAKMGAKVHIGHQEENLGNSPGGGDQQRGEGGQPRGDQRPPPPYPGDPPGRDAGRAHAAQIRAGRGRRPRQDHLHLHAGQPDGQPASWTPPWWWAAGWGPLGNNAWLGKGEFLVAEADESDGSFNILTPVVVVVTNVDREHMDHYGSEEALDQAFVQFMNKVPFYGAAVICLDDPRLAGLIPQVRKRTITYGLASQAGYQARELSAEPGGTGFSLYVQGQDHGALFGAGAGQAQRAQRPGGHRGGTGGGGSIGSGVPGAQGVRGG